MKIKTKQKTIEKITCPYYEHYVSQKGNNIISFYDCLYCANLECLNIRGPLRSYECGETPFLGVCINNGKIENKDFELINKNLQDFLKGNIRLRFP